jgi:hypothetical protein
MQSYTKKIFFGNKELTITLPFIKNQLINNILLIPNSAPLPNFELGTNTIIREVADFENDVLTFLRYSPEVKLSQNIYDNLCCAVQNHCDEFNRILPTDLFSYISIAVYLTTLIEMQHNNYEISVINRSLLFLMFLDNILGLFDSDMLSDLEKMRAVEPSTNYIMGTYYDWRNKQE